MTSRKDYVAIAKIICKYTERSSAYFNGIHHPQITQTVQRITKELADYFEQTIHTSIDKNSLMSAD